MICIICWDLGLLLHSSLPPDLRRFGGRLFLVFILINCLAPTMTDNGFSANKRMVINQIARHHVFVCVCARSRAADRGTGICGTNFVFTLFALFVRAASCVCVFQWNFHALFALIRRAFPSFFEHRTFLREFWSFSGTSWLWICSPHCLPLIVHGRRKSRAARKEEQIIFSEAAIANNAFWGMNELLAAVVASINSALMHT